MNSAVLTPIVMGMARHALTAVGGALFAQSCNLASLCANADTRNQVIGGAMFVFGLAWSVASKRFGVV